MPIQELRETVGIKVSLVPKRTAGENPRQGKGPCSPQEKRGKKELKMENAETVISFLPIDFKKQRALAGGRLRQGKNGNICNSVNKKNKVTKQRKNRT